jgi:hypothetical protein
MIGCLGESRATQESDVAARAVAAMAGVVIVVRSHWLVWAVAGGLAVVAMGGYLLTRSLSGGFLGDHGDVGNWRCPLGIAARRPRTSSALRALPGWPANRVDQDRPLRPVQ